VATPAPVEASEPEPPPRRRSTVREPAPVGAGGEPNVAPVTSMPPQPVELPQPAVSSTSESESADKPRRTGWWSRR
jgi:hypothetical protein